MSRTRLLPRRFPTTHWSQIARASDADPERKRQALQQLLVQYLPACRAHLQWRKRVPPQDVEDVLQSFVCDRVVAADLIAKADRSRGRFRSFLRASLDNYLSQYRRQARVRGPSREFKGAGMEGIQEPTVAVQRADVFDRAWAHQVVSQAVERMCQWCDKSHRQQLWKVFECRVLWPIFQNTPPPSYRLIVQRFGFASPMQASNALITAKRMFARTLESVIGQYASDESEIEAEMRELWGIFASGHPEDSVGLP